VAVDVAVIGSGMAGAAAALSARAAGASVLVLSRGPGASALSSGAADIAADGDAPLLDAMRSLPRPHPYRLLPDPAAALADAAELLRSLGYQGPGDRNLWLLSPLGCPKAAAFAQPFIAAGDLRGLAPDARPAVVALAGSQAIEARLQQQGLRRLFPQAPAEPLRADFYAQRTDALKGIPEMAADIDARRGDLEQALKRLARASGATHLWLPTFGLSPQPLDAGVPVFELPGAPPSVPGLRLQQRIDEALRAAGVARETAVVESLPDAAAVVLATGRFIGGGIRSGAALHETIFALPAYAGERRSLPSLPGEELFAVKASGRHAGLGAGIRVGPDLLAATIGGVPIFAAGAVIGGYDQSRDEGGLGAAALLGAAAGRNAAAAARTRMRASA